MICVLKKNALVRTKCRIDWSSRGPEKKATELKCREERLVSFLSNVNPKGPALEIPAGLCAMPVTWINTIFFFFNFVAFKLEIVWREERVRFDKRFIDDIWISQRGARRTKRIIQFYMALFGVATKSRLNAARRRFLSRINAWRGDIHILVYIIFLIAALWIFGTAAFRLVGFADESETPTGA